MTNLSYTGNAGSSGERAARSSPSPASPLVLIVEDHEDTRFLLRALLEMQGYRVVEAEDGEGAIQQAATLIPDLILMDGSLPRMDGISIMRRIREHAELRYVPVIFLSGHALDADREAAFAAGCDDYLIKPLDTDLFYRAVEKHTARRKLLTLVKTGADALERSTT